jgi:hypothetical protein
MITAIVNFPLPGDVDVAKAQELFEGSAPNYKGLAGLVRKYYLFQEGTGGGVYLWESREAADAVYTDEWKATIKARYGAEPTITYFESPVIVDNS